MSLIVCVLRFHGAMVIRRYIDSHIDFVSGS